MIHARPDYNRFQEPASLKSTIAFLLSVIERGEGLSEAKRNEILGQIRAIPNVPEGSNPIGEDEPVFLLRAKDKHFVAMLDAYACLLIHDRNPQTEEFERVLDEHAARAQAWASENGTKTPDLPATPPASASEVG